MPNPIAKEGSIMLTSINIYTLKQHRIAHHRFDLDLPITTPEACHHLLDLLLDLKREPVEKFGIISLNTKYKPLGLHVLAAGSLDSVTVEPREVFKAAMINNAFAIIAFHNHPSGDPEPSVWDIAITRRLKEVGDFLNISLVDHLIIGEEKWFSMKEGRLL
jgi:DNA repair protein RadC